MRISARGLHRAVRQDGDRGRRTLSDVEPRPISRDPGVCSASRARRTWTSAHGAAGVLVAPKAFGYERNGIASLASARLGARVPGGFGYLEALAGGLYDSGGSGQRRGPACRHRGASARGPIRLAFCTWRAGWLENPVPGTEFDLGLGTGPRAFRSHSFTGDRSYFGTAEYRVTVVDDFLGMIGLGIAGFVDHGGAWYAGSRGGPAGTPASAFDWAPAAPPIPTPCASTSRAASGTTLRAPGGSSRSARGSSSRLWGAAAIIGRPQPSRP